MQKMAGKDSLRTLLAEVRQENGGAFERLAEQYRSLTEAAVHRFAPAFGISGDFSVSQNGYDPDDLRQCAAMALYRAAVTYDPDGEKKGRNVSFGLYAKVCIHNAMITELRKYKREQKKRAVSQKTEDADTKRRKGCAAEDPLYRIASDETMRETLAVFRCALSGYEREVFECYIVGKSVTEIAERLGKDEKSVSNAIYRMKVKIRGLLKN